MIVNSNVVVKMGSGLSGPDPIKAHKPIKWPLGENFDARTRHNAQPGPSC